MTIPSDEDATPTPDPVAEAAPIVPAPPVRIRYAGLPHLPSPVLAAGKWWHGRTEHTVSAAHAAELLAREGFHAVTLRTTP